MHFARIDFLYAALGLIPLLGVFLWWSWRQRQRLITQFVQSRLLAVLTVGVSRRRQQLRLWLLVLGVTATLVALARPQWGFGYQEVKQRGLDIIIALDTSKSMLAEDVAPNRLARAKLAALDLRRLSRSDRMGLVAFAGSAFLQMPMSIDEDVFRQHLESLDTSTLPQGGTAIAEAIQTARNAFKVGGGENHRALVLFTDGEDHDSAAVDAAREAAKEGLHIFTIGVGTPGGELLRIRDAKGRTEFIKDENGNAVKSRLNEALLQELAQAGGGFYLQLSGTGAMEMLQERGLAPLPKMDFQATVMRQYFERFQWFLGLALLLVIAELFVPDRKPPVRVATGSAMRIAASRATSPALLLAALLALLPRPAGASPSSAARDYEAGKFKTALNEYQRLLEKNPNDAPLRYNAGTAAYQAGKFESAVEHFSSALATPDPHLQEQAYYNRGNSRFRSGQEAGEPKKTQELWKQAVADYETALKLSPDDKDAAHNLEVVRKKLEELQQQQQQQQNQDQKGDESKDKKDDQQQKQDPNSKDDKKQDGKDSQQQKDPKEDKKDPSKSQDPSQQKDGADQKQDQPKDAGGGEKKDGAQAGDDKEKDKEKKPAAQETARQDKGEGKEGGEPQGAVQPMQMTRKQAIQLLEALRSEERLLTMPPPRTNRTQRTFKDW
jgi:Ca-activated chloride channel family protein